MKMSRKDGTGTELDADALEFLKRRLRGPLLPPESPGYDEARKVWNGMIDRRPGLVVRCLGLSDILTAVKFARQRDILLCVKSGGHNIAGLAVADGALLLDLSLMRGIWVDPKARTARAEPGCLLSDLDRETQVHGLAAVLGFVSTTGISGLTLGGGFGYLTRRCGWAADNLAGMDVVTAEGALVRASPKENPDLFWALRGGGGNFGVVAGFDYRLHPVGPEVVGGLVAWPIEEAGEVLRLYREMSESAPPELTLVAFLRPAPPAPWLPKSAHGRMMVALLAAHTGDPGQGEKLVAPIKAFGRPIGDVLARRPYVQVQSLLDSTQPKGRRYYWKSEYLRSASPALCDRLIARAGRIPSPHSGVILFHIGGALNRLPAGHSPAGNRDARYVLALAGAWEKPEADGENISWVRESWSEARRFSTGGTYLNFLTADEGNDRTQAALGPALKRLREIKAKWDPDNFFRTNRNVAPSGAP